ncbi:MAG: VWA domain-containing protein, partial [Rhodobacteraceae bacterium]|nr:VWA domain-containing protein [Paracoccaceae bacterium]
NPELCDIDRVELSHKLNSQVMSTVMESPKYKELRLLTKMDTVNATVGTEVMGEQVKQLVEELKDQFEDAMKAAQQAQEAVEKAEQDETQEGEPGDATEGQAHLDLETAKKLLEEAMKTVNDQITKTEARKINRLLDNTIAETRETMDTITSWGLDQDPTYERTSHQEKIKLLTRLRQSRKLRELAELAGRYKRMALTSRREKIKKGSEEVFDTTYGDEIGKLLSNETLKLLEPELEMLFKKDLLEKQLLQYEYKGTEKKCKGPIVCCIDSSGSMSGSREIWAKAVALGVLDIAKGQKRDFTAIHFDSTQDPKRLHRNTFLKHEKQSFEKIIGLAEIFLGGGTLFEPALELAQSIIMKEPNFSKADIIFITDGECAVRDNWLHDFLQWKQEKHVSIYGVLIDSGWNSNVTLDEFSDTVIKLSELEQNQNKAAEEIFGIID